MSHVTAQATHITTSSSSHNAARLQPREAELGLQCAYILGLAAQHNEVKSSFVTVPASADPMDDKQPAGKDKLLIG